MALLYTAKRNEESIETIRSQIKRKTSQYPYMSNGQNVSHVITDMDHHPYTRWFRGVPEYPDPVIMEREAGFRPMENNCYDVNPPVRYEIEASYCFEPPCNTIFPCDPKSFSDKMQQERRINNECIVQYR